MADHPDDACTGVGEVSFLFGSSKVKSFFHIILFFPVIVKNGTNLYVYNVHFDRFIFDNVRLKRI